MIFQMKLNRNLFYTMIIILVFGIILICSVEETSIVSRIATGLITGSFVCTISTLVNYFHNRNEFFAKYSMSASELSRSLLEDFIRFKLRIEHLECKPPILRIALS